MENVVKMKARKERIRDEEFAQFVAPLPPHCSLSIEPYQHLSSSVKLFSIHQTDERTSSGNPEWLKRKRNYHLLML